MQPSLVTSALTQEIALRGFAVIPQLCTPPEIAALLQGIESAPAAGPNFRRSQDVFAIRNLLGELPDLLPLLRTPVMRQIL